MNFLRFSPSKKYTAIHPVNTMVWFNMDLMWFAIQYNHPTHVKGKRLTDMVNHWMVSYECDLTLNEIAFTFKDAKMSHINDLISKIN